MLLQSEGLGGGAGEDLIAEEAGVPFVQTSDRGNVDIEGTVTAFYRYSGALNRLLAMAIGQDTAAQIAATTAYTHTMIPQATLDAIFGTLAIDKNVSVWEWPGVKVKGFTISGEAGQPINIEFEIIANTLNRNTSGGVNNNTTITNVTYRSKALRALFNHLTLRMHNQSDAALGAGDKLNITSFSLEFTRPMSAAHISSQREVIEPTGDGLPEITLEIELPEYTADTHLSDLDAETLKKIDLDLDSGVDAGSSNNYRLLIDIPQAKIIDAEAAVDGAGKIVHPLTLRLEEAQTAPSGMTATRPLQIVATNQHTTSELA